MVSTWRAERLGDRDEAFAELAGDDDKDRIAGAQDVDQRRFHHRRAGAGEGQHVMRGAEDRLQALMAFRQHGPELGAAVIEDRQRGGLADAFGDGSRAGKRGGDSREWSACGQDTSPMQSRSTTASRE